MGALDGMTVAFPVTQGREPADLEGLCAAMVKSISKASGRVTRT